MKKKTITIKDVVNCAEQTFQGMMIRDVVKINFCLWFLIFYDFPGYAEWQFSQFDHDWTGEASLPLK